MYLTNIPLKHRVLDCVKLLLKTLGSIGLEAAKRTWLDCVDTISKYTKTSKAYTHFCAKEKGRIERLFGRKAEKMSKENLIQFHQEMHGKRAYEKKSLDFYSTWFGAFDPKKYHTTMVMPGCVAGPTIMGFGIDCLVMSSIRAPKRIKIRGSDEKEYSFLVKAGEDLRLDARIEQLFTVMNGLLQRDPECVQRDLRLQTYKVIPLSTQLGLLEWVDNTVPVQTALERQYREARRSKRKKYEGMHEWDSSKVFLPFRGDMVGKLYKEPKKGKGTCVRLFL